MIKILHAADFHLDSAFHGLTPEQASSRRQEQRHLVEELIDLCQSQKCDLILLAGDLFDSDRAYTDTIDLLIRNFSRCPVPIFIAPGNHDFYTPGSPYQTAAWPENVHIFTSPHVQTIALPALDCLVSGAAFTTPRSQSMLENFSADKSAKYHLMVLHGEVDIPASSYNPITKEQIAAANLTYLALGHIHQASGLKKAGKTHYAWPGCSMGRGFDETGPKGVYLITIDDAGPQAQFIPLSGRRYETLQVRVGDDPLSAIMAALPADTQDHIYRIFLTGPSPSLDLNSLYEVLSSRFFSLQLRDQTIPIRDVWAHAGEDNLKGLFLQELSQAIASDPKIRDIATLAAQLTLAIMEHREVPES